MQAAFDSFGWQPRLVAGGAAVTVAVLAYLAFLSKTSVGAGVLALALCVTIALLAALVRTPMPSAFRTGLTLALIASVLCLALKANLVLLQPVQHNLDHALDFGNSSDIYRARTTTARSAEVKIRGLDVDQPWSKEAHATLTGAFADDIPGAGDWRISGETLTHGEQATMDLSLSWHVLGLGRDADCGVLGIASDDPTAALAAVRERFRRAIRKSALEKRAVCE